MLFSSLGSFFPINLALFACVMAIKSRAVAAAASGGAMMIDRSNGVLQPRAPTQSEQAIQGSRGNITIAIAAAAGVAGAILLLLITWKLLKHHKARQAARYAAAHPEMVQAGLLPPTTASAARTATTSASRPRRPRRQPSTQTVPEYSEQAGDEEMILDKAEGEDVQLENAAPTVSLLSTTSSRSSEGDDANAHYAATAAYTPRRTSYAVSRSTLHDIENPAPELRMDRVDTIQTTNAPSLLSSSDNGHQPLISSSYPNESTLSLDEVQLDGMPLRHSSFFGSPAYVNRSRSHSIDIVRTMSSAQEANGTSSGRPTSSGATLEIPNARRQSSFMAFFPRRQSNSSSVLPLHQPLTESRREALRNREISAPIGETLVRTSYTYPKAGINPIQAAWLGSRDHITRLATYLDTAPPAFEEEDQSLELDRRASRDTTSTEPVSGHTHPPSAADPDAHRRPTAANVLSQLEEESAQLSSLVHQESLRRASLPPHMVALPPSLPVSPVSPRTYGGNSDWPISRANSIARAHSLARKRLSTDGHALDRQSSVARRRVQSANQPSPSLEHRRTGPPAPVLPRSESPTPSPRDPRPVLSLSLSTNSSMASTLPASN